jgi:Holliday junction resolvasome RuvABC DNA-binding subunit
LINMGYSRAQAREVVQKLPPDVGSVEEAVKAALYKQS